MTYSGIMKIMTLHHISAHDSCVAETVDSLCEDVYGKPAVFEAVCSFVSRCDLKAEQSYIDALCLLEQEIGYEALLKLDVYEALTKATRYLTY